jgi:hypothetical protein
VRLPPADDVYEAGRHRIRVALSHRSWMAWLDGLALPGRFENRADAWCAGVAEADRLDRLEGRARSA